MHKIRPRGGSKVRSWEITGVVKVFTLIRETREIILCGSNNNSYGNSFKIDLNDPNDLSDLSDLNLFQDSRVANDTN